MGGAGGGINPYLLLFRPPTPPAPNLTFVTSKASLSDVSLALHSTCRGLCQAASTSELCFGTSLLIHWVEARIMLSPLYHILQK